MKKFVLILFTFCALVLSCTKIIESDQIYLSYSSYTFNSGCDSLIIGVNSNTDWYVECSADWVNFSEIDDNSVKVSVTENITKEKRTAVLEFVAGTQIKKMDISQLFNSFSGHFADFDESLCLSRNGKYGAFLKAEYYDDGTDKVMIVIKDCETGKDIRAIDGKRTYTGINAISNDGRIIVVRNTSGVDVYKDDAIVDFSVPECNSYVIHSISYDNRIMVGYAYSNSPKRYYPVKWTDGKPEILPLPDYDILGNELVNGGMARGCSDDGSVIYGSEWNTTGLIYWKNGELFYPSDENKEIKVIRKEVNGVLTDVEVTCYYAQTAESCNISANGRYIASTMRDYIDLGQNEVSQEVYYPVIVDTETCKGHVIRITGLTDFAGMTADNDGLCYAGTPRYGVKEGYVFDFRTMTALTLQEWMSSRYGIIIGTNRLVSSVSDNGKMIFGSRVEETLTGTQYPVWCYIAE